MGACPDWYERLGIARRLDCKIWELSEVSIYWQDIGKKAIQAENLAAQNKKQQMN